ncbi:MAG: hypothetical protein IJV58_00585 [Oscillospiraceae bacterium]|nr:hypothetical protein [Oscillospiraceae bacterium]
MSRSLLRTDREIAEIYERHRLTVYRVCFAYMKDPMDACIGDDAGIAVSSIAAPSSAAPSRLVNACEFI